MRILKTKVFARFSRKESISDSTLLATMSAAERKPEADLGGGVIKQRVARANQGKSGGYRTIILYRKGDRAFFVDHKLRKEGVFRERPTSNPD